MSENTKKPVHEVRLGAVKATIWLNDTTNGHMHNVTVSRTYRDGEEWKSSLSFGEKDLLPLAKALSEAHSYINQQKQSQPRNGTAARTAGKRK